MADLPSPPMPRWVKAFGIVFAGLVLVFAVLHLTGNGFSFHAAQSGLTEQGSP